MINDLIELMIYKFADLGYHNIYTYSTYIDIYHGDNFVCMIKHTSDDIEVYFSFYSNKCLKIRYDEITDIDMLVGKVICDRFYNDK